MISSFRESAVYSEDAILWLCISKTYLMSSLMSKVL